MMTTRRTAAGISGPQAFDFLLSLARALSLSLSLSGRQPFDFLLSLSLYLNGRQAFDFLLSLSLSLYLSLSVSQRATGF